MKIQDLFDVSLLAEMMEQKYVRRQNHPTAPLAILNYTEHATFDKVWNEVTMTCRGLVYDFSTGEVLARPFRKFFNYGEPGAELGSAYEPVAVTDKIDGSLGILYRNPYTGKYEFATRGSFTSEQAVHATKLLNTKYEGWKPRLCNSTYLFEIVYPENRIVVDYGKTDDLVLLGAVDITTGYSFPDITSAYGWSGPVTEQMPADSLTKALALPPRPNAEGVVVRFIWSDKRVKVKQEDYVKLHRLINGMNARVIWEQLGLGLAADQICQGVPEEFWPWIRQVADEIESEHTRLMALAHKQYEQIISTMPEGWTRKDFAEQANRSYYRPWLFLLLDGRDPGSAIWQSLKPSAERALMNRTEDAA